MKEMEEGYFEGDQPWSNEDQPPKWDALQVACGFAATLLLFACWANVFTASVGVVGGIIAIISIFLSEGLARKVMAGIVGGALILIALAEWSFPSFQQPLAWYPDDPSDGLVPYRMRPLYGVFLNIWGWVCFSSIFLVPGGEGYERYVSSNLKFYVGRLIASFFLFIYGLFGLINLITYNYNYEYYYALGMALGIPCELGVMVAAALLVASIKKKSFQLAMIAAIVGAIFLILNKFFGFFGIVYTGYFMPFISLRIFNYAFACSMAVVWVIVCYDYGQGGGVGGGGVGGGGVVGDGDLEKGDWPVDLCDCCGDGCDVCLWGTFCGCCMHGQTDELLTFGRSSEPCEMHCSGPCWLTWLLGCCHLYWILPCLLRGRIRQNRAIDGNACFDCCLSWCCSCCVVIQQYRTVSISRERIVNA